MLSYQVYAAHNVCTKLSRVRVVVSLFYSERDLILLIVSPTSFAALYYSCARLDSVISVVGGIVLQLCMSR